MPERILVIVSCTLMYFQYPDGSVSPPYRGHFCSGDQAAAAEDMRRRHRRAWKQAMSSWTIPRRRPRPVPTRPAPTWARDFGTRRGWK